MLRPDRRAGRGQSHGAEVRWRSLWRKHQAHPLPLPRAEDAADSAGERHHRGFIKNEDFKYVRLLGAMYMRLTGTAADCYKYLEPLYNDYRKIKSQNRNGEFELMHR
ncbi:unnamed protein product [Pleuronectes platessa]|uniref:Pre-mRNA-splicing factor 38B n=1 Tax=Pleuronectes platessa TaxID=8262 RepID=A0A9N7Z555_PLEPL|nr:unnamed protein product [Pleuronectes platessa]